MNADIKYSYRNAVYEVTVELNENTYESTTVLKTPKRTIPSDIIQLCYPTKNQTLDFREVETDLNDLCIRKIEKVVNGPYKIIFDKKKPPSICFQGPHSIGDKISIIPEEISYEEFATRFNDPDVCNIGTGDVDFINKAGDSLISSEMNDCITIFVIEKKSTALTLVFGYHISSGSTAEEMEDTLRGELTIDSEARYEIVIIGGNNDEQSKGLLTLIQQKFLPKVFKNYYDIIGIFYNLIENSGFDYISTHIDMKAHLTFCKHN
ncbi:hypothetical protein PHSC3_001822 [Chlamydiales bacterium STE3]|nr:hypothetical protein PHSC3_001822 [Chlamydiales bacterium STE3]